MTKFDAKTIAWIKDTLCNDEYASDEEMLAYFIKEGPLTKAEAEKWLKLRNFYRVGLPKPVAVMPRQTPCPHCAGLRLQVVLHYKGWWLECARCGDVLAEQEQHRYFMAPSWQLM